MRHCRHFFRFILVSLLAFFSPAQIQISGAAPGSKTMPTEAMSAETMHGDTLMTYCAGQYDVDLGICTGYILAIAETMVTGQASFGQHACGHDGIKAQQLVDLVRLELGQQPDLKNQPAGVMVANVLASAFPCLDDLAPAAGGAVQSEVLP